MKRTVPVLIVVLALGAACGGDDVNDPAPTLIPGGGVSSGAIRGVLNVHVIDSRTDEAIDGAAVRVGLPAESAPLTGTTDSTGLAIFRHGSLAGPQYITVSKAGYAAASWIGANGANVTIPLDPTDPPAVGQASVEGTIEGWDAMPAPASNHYRLALVLYSYTREIGAPENTIAQPTVTGGLPANACINIGAMSPACAWRMNVRTGQQIHYAIIVDGDSKGTLADTSDDTYVLEGYAVKADVGDITAGLTISDEVLTPLGPEDLIDFTVAFQSAPAGLDDVVALPAIDAGDKGLLLLPLPPLTPEDPSTQVPALTGAFAGGSFLTLARAIPASGEEPPSSAILQRELDGTTTVELGAWLAPPTDVQASGGTYSYTATSGATVHIAEIYAAGDAGALGDKAWSILLLDGSTQFTLPSLTPDALPTGDLVLQVGAMEIPGLSLTDFQLEGLEEIVTRMSANDATFTH